MCSPGRSSRTSTPDRAFSRNADVSGSSGMKYGASKRVEDPIAERGRLPLPGDCDAHPVPGMMQAEYQAGDT